MNSPDHNDQDARQQALDIRRSFIVQAPAGSGKTGLLTQRLLRLLAVVDHPEEVVAVTFTRKAAAEMRGRVLAALAASQQEPPVKPHELLTWQLARTALAADQQHGWRLLDNPRRLRILTIDALCAWLTRQLPMLSGFGGQPQVVADPYPLYQLAARATLAELAGATPVSEAVAMLLVHLDNHRLTAEALLADLLARREQWLRHVASGVPDRQGLEAALRKVTRAGLLRCRQELPAGLDDEIVDLGRFAAAQMMLQDREDLADLRALQRFPRPDAEDLPIWQGLADLLLTSAGQWRRRVSVREGFPPNARLAKKRMISLLEDLADREALRQRWAEVRLLPPPAYLDHQWQVLAALLTLLPRAVAHLWVIFAERGQTDFAEISRRAILALGGAESPTDLALRLDYRIRHLLVDEFQDTSIPQFQLLERLIAGWTGADGRTLFLVGDPMQSIYRFREAEVGLFLLARQQGIGSSVRLHPLTLTVNFRSCAEVVQWVNAAFMHVLPEKDDPLAGAVSYVPSVAHHPAAGAGAGVHFHPLVAGTPAQEADQVVALAKAALVEAGSHGVAILARSRSHLPWILQALRDGGVPHQAVEIARLGGRMVAQDLMSLTRLLLQPADRLSMLAVLRAPWCGLSLADLMVIARHGEDMAAAVEDLSLSPAGCQRLTRVMAVLHHAMGQRRLGSLRLLVEGCWIGLGGPQTLRDEGDRADATAFLDLLGGLEEGGDLRDLETLQRRLDLAPTSGQASRETGVQVMTIHKAKGLEFDVVILPGLSRQPPPAERRLLLWQELPDPEDGLLLAPMRRADSREDPIFTYLQYLDQNRERLETGRLLYVAATRARRALHLVARLHDDWLIRPPPANSFLAMMWEVLAGFMSPDQQGVQQEEVALPVADQAGFPLRRLPADWVLPPMPPALATTAVPESADLEPVLFEWAGETVRLVGVVVHRLLRRMAEEGLANWRGERLQAMRPAIYSHLVQLGVSSRDMARAGSQVLAALAATLADERGRWLLSPHAEAASEMAITGLLDGRIVHAVLDRTFVDEQGVRWIVDFKTSTHLGSDVETFLDHEQERYHAQLERYARLLAPVTRGPIRLGLYFPMLRGWRTWEAHKGSGDHAT